MIRKLPLFAPFLLLLLLVACASLTPAGRKIEVFDSEEDVVGCTPIGRLHAEGSNAGGGYSVYANHDVDVKIRNLAAEEGGDTLLLTKNDNGFFSGSKRAGVIYRCDGKRKPAQSTAQ